MTDSTLFDAVFFILPATAGIVAMFMYTRMKEGEEK